MDEVIGPAVTTAARALQPGDVLVLENLRFHPGEQAGDPAFAKQLAMLGDVYVNDAFGTCHRDDASMVAVPQAMGRKPRVTGFLVARELQILDRLLSSPQEPVLGILGGAKVSDKIAFIKSLLGRVQKLLVGGAMTYTLMLAQGQRIGQSRAEADKLDLARELLQKGKGKIILPRDHLVVDKGSSPGRPQVVEGEIPDDWVGVDIGPKTIAHYADEIVNAGTAVWNGPMGKFEDEAFSHGTRSLAQALSRCSGITIVGGGETAEAVEAFGLAEKITHVSTGGGAFLEYIAGTPFKALEVLDDK
jgi:phosphoglycerate kinase